jgi:hypothetical protein
MRTIYRVNDNDFDLTQFGLFLTGDTLFLTFHLNDMVATIGRKIMAGDVFELPHLKDYYPLDDDLPAALKRYYVVQDASRASEGFAPTWWPHLWRVKVTPLVDSQEYKDILNKIPAGDTNKDGKVNKNGQKLGELLSTYNSTIAVNDAIVARAEQDVQASGYDTSFIYHESVTDTGYPGNDSITSADKVKGYLTEDGRAPNVNQVVAGITFPSSPNNGDYYLRLDYVPNRLFRYNGNKWVKIEDSVRTNLNPGVNNKTQLSTFINNEEIYFDGNAIATDVIRVANPYIPPINSQTLSFDFGTKQIITNTVFNIDYKVKLLINGVRVNPTVSSVTVATVNRLAITISDPIQINDQVEYTIYDSAIPQKQALSNILRPSADN